MRGRTWEAKLITAAVLLIIAAGLVLLAAARWKSGSTLLVIFYLVAAAILAATAIGIISGAIEKRRLTYLEEQIRLAAAWEKAEPEVVRLEAMTQLVTNLKSASPTVLQILAGDPLLAKVIAGNFGPIAAVITKDGEVPYSYLDEWWATNKSLDILVPVGQWPTTANKRQYASWLERHLIDLKFLVSWGGRKTAKWTSEEAKLEFLEYFYGERINRVKEGEG
jgi:hypothetical protein